MNIGFFVGEMTMAHTLESFSAACHRLLKAEPGPAGREKVCELLQDVLKDETFVSTHLSDNCPERNIIYEDPELGFCILAHYNQGAKESPPHDHGPTWAIYGQADGVTEMTDWELVEPAAEGKAGKVRAARVYTLNPGDAYVYNEGDLHSPRRDSSTKLIRFEGVNTETIQRYRYEAV
jgi:hypothetical protein